MSRSLAMTPGKSCFCAKSLAASRTANCSSVRLKFIGAKLRICFRHIRQRFSPLVTASGSCERQQIFRQTFVDVSFEVMERGPVDRCQKVRCLDTYIEW